MHYTLPHNTLRFWRTAFALSVLFQSALFGGLYWFMFEFLERLDFLKPHYAVFMTVMVLTWVLIWWHLGAKHRRFQLHLTEKNLTVRQGVFWQREILIPRPRLQYVDLRQSPFERKFGLGTLILYTAGTALPAIIIPQLDHQDAQTLQEQLRGERA